jgi:hypothetical protein
MVQSNDNVTEGTMPDEDKMTIDERYKYLRIKQKQYARASRSERFDFDYSWRQVAIIDA